MYGPLRCVFIVVFLCCRDSSGIDMEDNDTDAPDTSSILMLLIGAGILLAILVLVGLVSCLYHKLAHTLSAPSPAVCLALKNHPAVVTGDKIPAAPHLGASCHPSFQYCEACPLYPDLESLPPCFCDMNEGL